jgi:hypothetical protein
MAQVCRYFIPPSAHQCYLNLPFEQRFSADVTYTSSNLILSGGIDLPSQQLCNTGLHASGNGSAEVKGIGSLNDFAVKVQFEASFMFRTIFNILILISIGFLQWIWLF